ncbi:MAG: hypothetical protein V4494_00250 [Chlamydiota bacterium]
MKRLILILTLFFTPIFAEEDAGFVPHLEESQLIINNRILAQVNDKTISVLDLVKKMDVFLSRNYPQALESSSARFQFYSSNWRTLLEQMIDHELILADSHEKEIKATDAEIREQMMERFGPNIMSSLDKLGMTYDEARAMVASDLVVQKMTWYRVNNKALQKVNSLDVKKAYLNFCEQHPPVEEWQYQVLSIRADSPEKSEEIAHQAYTLLKTHAATLSSIPERLIADNPCVSITVSQDYRMDSKTISPAHKQVLTLLSPSAFSEPVSQVSRLNSGTVYRIFLLKDYVFTPTPSFEQIADKLQNDLIQQSVAQETTTYIGRLRNHFGFDTEHTQQMMPSNFEPFAIR